MGLPKMNLGVQEIPEDMEEAGWVVRGSLKISRNGLSSTVSLTQT